MDDLAASPGGEAQKELLTVPTVFTWVYTKEWPPKPVDICPSGLISMFLPQRMQEVHMSLCHVSSKMASLARKSHGRPYTDTHRTGAGLPSPHMGMTKAPHQPAWLWHLHPPYPSPHLPYIMHLFLHCHPKSAITSKPRSLFLCLHCVLTTPGWATSQFLPVQPAWFSGCAVSTSQEAVRQAKFGGTGEDMVNISLCCFD